MASMTPVFCCSTVSHSTCGRQLAGKTSKASMPQRNKGGRPARAAHGDRADAGHDLTLGQMPVAYQSPAAIIGELIGMAAEQARNPASTAYVRSARAPLRKTSVSGSLKVPG
jgi:hypothetical protein